jgi:alpha-L-fucosidase
LVQNLRSHNATLAVGYDDNFFHIRIRAIGLDIFITHSGLLSEKIERALKNTFEEIAEHSVSSVVDSENRTPKGFSQHVNILLDVVSRNTTSINQ